VINRIVRVVPTAVRVALGIALALVLLTGALAVWSARRARRADRSFASASAAALTDPLTGVLNRRGFAEVVERELARSRRHGHPFALAYVDIRGLKAVNDSEGHLAGDRLLQEAAALLRESARASDVVGRLGGDELGMMLIEQSTDGAAAVSSRIKSKVEARRPKIGLKAPWDLTVGFATFPEDGDTFEALLRAADARLYEQRGIALPNPAPARP
jgi:diguanylate cyclase (GGDEF)-like protein